MGLIDPSPLIAICPLVSEVFMFESVTDGRTDGHTGGSRHESYPITSEPSAQVC